MLSRVATFFALFYAACANELQKTTPRSKVPMTNLSEIEIAVSITVCITAAVLVILLPTIFYYKYWNKDPEHQIMRRRQLSITRHLRAESSFEQ